jgi:hypothetical protein
MTIAISGTNGITLDGQFNSASSMGFKNRIINSDMRIDQRNAGASVTPTATAYTLDRWQFLINQSSKFTTQQSSTAPTGFINSILVTSSSAYSVLTGDYFTVRQAIEGLNVADFAWGTANAVTVTLSFWVRSSLTGTFGGAINNNAGDRSYPFTYTINSANTFEQKTVTIAGDTSGTWLTTNSRGMMISFGFGVGTTFSGTAGAWAGANYLSATGATSVVGTNGATFYITGVQLEKGSTATSFDYRPYGTELALCQRYYESTAFPDASFGISSVRITVSSSTTSYAGGFNYLVPKRTNSPTVTLYSRNNNSGKVSLVSTGADVAGTSTANNIGGTGFWGVAIGTPPAAGSGIEAGWTASAEL